MDAWSSTVNRNLELQSAAREAAKDPLQVFRVSPALLKMAEDVFFPLMPEHGFAKEKPEWHVVDQRFQRAWMPVLRQKVSMHPGRQLQTGCCNFPGM